MARNYNDSFNEAEDLNEEVDFEFFEEAKTETSEPKKNVSVKAINNEIKELSISNVDKNSNNHTQNNSFDKSVQNSTQDDYKDSSFEDTSVDSSTSLSVKSSDESSSPSQSDNLPDSTNANRNAAESSLSTRPTNSIQDESEMTSVSSIESDGSEEPAEILDTTTTTTAKKPSKPPMHNAKHQNTRHRGQSRSSVDYDVIPAEVILQTMMRIHEERRLVQKMRPKWVDPNTKDYSVSGITKKLNLVPERIVSMSKNIRNNPFYCPPADDRRLYHTAINRNREQDRIDRENRELLYRLQNIRPSPGITKDELLKEYSKLSRFSSNPQNKPRLSFRSPSCRPLSSSNSSNYMKARPPPSSTIVSRYGDSRLSSYRKSETNSRVMSASSLASHNSRPSSNASLKKKKRKQ